MPTALTPAQIRRVAEQIAAARDTMRGGSMNRPIKFTRDPVTAALIRQCVARAVRLHLAAGGTDDKINLEMDLSAAHANGCPMDFAKLLAFDDGSFLHDITGIQNNISRISGRMTGHFLPRAAIGARP